MRVEEALRRRGDVENEDLERRDVDLRARVAARGRRRKEFMVAVVIVGELDMQNAEYRKMCCGYPRTSSLTWKEREARQQGNGGQATFI